ncbi:MAG TPA: CPBP family intramembrane glutamic endopeptidase, partial [Bacillota bacterium]|nr:CPBP family intramembrane glutamic endopeptidase [Bacillota bacterium]
MGPANRLSVVAYGRDLTNPRSHAGQGVLVVAATLAAALSLAGGAGAQILAAVVLTALTGVALTSGVPGGIRACVFLGSVFVVFVLSGLIGVPGPVTTVLVGLLPVTVLLAAAALTVWAAVARPEPPSYARTLQEMLWWIGVIGVAGFALVNPVWEELLFRGVVLQEIAGAWGMRLAVPAQAVLFGAAHWAGFPSGWVGMALAASWGFV